MTNIPPAVVIDPATSSVLPPSPATYTHEPLSPPTDHSSRRRRSSGSVAVNIQNPSTESLASSSSPLPLTNEPLAIGIPTAHSSPISIAPEIHEGSPQPSPTASSVISEFFLPEGRFLQLIHSDQVPRYLKETTIPRDETSYYVKPLTTVFPYFEFEEQNPWRPATHPDGALYFFDPERRLFTDTNMHDALLRDEIEELYHYLQKILRADQLTIPSNNYDLVLDITPIEDGRIQWSYYYACHDNRCLFWLETYDASYMLSELIGVSSPAHIKHRLEASYWNHWSLFPVVFEGRSLPLPVYDELAGILSYGCVDVMSSMSSTLPYDDDTMYKMINLVRKAKEADGGVQYYTAATTRLLSFFAHWRFLYFHGQRHARLVRDQTVYNKPKLHLRDVERLWTDDVIIETVWKSFMTKLLGEWGDVILWSAVMLTANVGFLAIPGVVLSNLNGSNITSASDVNIFTSPSQIASSLSIEASVGSIVTGLLLVRHNRTKQKEDPAGAVSA
ncbi:hypothetical protein BJV78DRAFT_826291 [Lactifluus subvellereus]|nr:hypothetical protein BJV78DRAFT_826291 [Lactifluus subvellereus]